VLDEIGKDGFFDNLTHTATTLLQGLQMLADKHGIAFTTTQVGGMFGCYFNTTKTISTFEQVMQSDVTRFKRYFHSMLSQGIYLAPSAFEAGFVSGAHGKAEIDKTLAAADQAFASLKN